MHSQRPYRAECTGSLPNSASNAPDLFRFSSTAASVEAGILFWTFTRAGAGDGRHLTSSPRPASQAPPSSGSVLSQVARTAPGPRQRKARSKTEANQRQNKGKSKANQRQNKYNGVSGHGACNGMKEPKGATPSNIRNMPGNTIIVVLPLICF